MRKLLIGVAAAGALAITTGTALALSAQDDSGQPSSSPTLTTPTSTSTSSTSASSTSATAAAPGNEKLSAEDASKIVQAKLGGGQVHEIEREFEHGRVEWKVEITAPDGKTYDIRIDAETGQITRTDLDSDSDDHGGKDDD